MTMQPDTARQIDTVERRLGTRTLEGGEARVATIEQTYDTTVDDLWDALTNPERIPRWFLPVSGDLRTGGHYQLEGNANGTIQTCEPPHVFTATWEFGGEVSWIEVRVEPVPEGARLALEHTAHVNDEWWDQYGPGATGVGWDLALLGLATHLAAPDAEKPDESWITQGPGRAFATASSDRWAEASIAAGTPEDQARAAAGRTTAFYTGDDAPA